MHNNANSQPKVGVGVMIFKDGKILLGKRRGSHGAGEYSFPGGHLEYMESFENTALREIKEECGIEIEGLRFQYIANVTKYSPKHYIHFGFIADWKNGEPKPEKCESWHWYDPNRLPGPLFYMAELAIKNLDLKKVYLDVGDLRNSD